MFRELAVSYLSRFDLGHVDPSENAFDALGKGEDEGKLQDAPPAASKYLSRGLTRSRTDKLGVISGSPHPSPSGEGGARSSSSGAQQAATNVTSFHSAGATALKADTKPAAGLDRLEWQQVEERMRAMIAEPKQGQNTRASASVGDVNMGFSTSRDVNIERRAEAKAKGYVGESCGECHNFTLVRNGTCLKCDTCGSTTGCS